ncbi:MAG: cell division protein FtsA [bacterium]
MALPPVVAVEIGTVKVVALVGERREDGGIAIIGMGEHSSRGVRKGEVVDLDNAVACVRGALRGAEESAQVTIRRVHVAVSGGHIQSHINRGSTRVLSQEGEIAQADIDEVMNLARAVNLPPDREILHTICRHFCVDDQQYVANPKGLSGAKLSLDMLALHGMSSRLLNTIKVVQNVPIDVQDVAFGGLCAGLAVLTPEQKEAGALVIDLGGGTTDYVAYCDKMLASAGVLAVGGEHVTNDISLAFNLSLRQAEFLKIEHGSAVVDLANRTKRVSAPPEVGFSERPVNLPSLHTVINVRMKEVFEVIKSRLENCESAGGLGAGVVLTGGCAKMKGVTELAEKVFNVPCSVGVVRDVDGLAAASEGPEYAVAVGMVRYGLTNTQEESGFSFSEWLKGFFGKG